MGGSGRTARNRRYSSASPAGQWRWASLLMGLPVSGPAVSQHLKVLKCAVRDLWQNRTGGRTRRVYQLNPKGIQDLRAD